MGPIHFSLAVAVLALGTACGGVGGDPPPPPLAAIESCKDGWQPMTAPRASFTPRNLTLHGNELIYVTSGDASNEFKSQIEAQAIAGGAPRVVATAEAWALWVEGDDVYYASGTTLGQVPVVGGPTTEMLRGPPTTPSTPIFLHLLTPTDFVWGQLSLGRGTKKHNEIWAAAREGGEPRLLANIDSDELLEGFALAGDTVLAAAADAQTWAVPVAGGAPRTLAKPGLRLAGLEKGGVYGYELKPPAFQTFEMQFAPIDGGAALPFWSDPPLGVAPEYIWANGNAGWLVSALEIFDDGLPHRSIFLLDTAEQATRVACSPSSSDSDVVSVPPVFAGDSAYIIDENVGDTIQPTWSIIQVPLAH